MTSGTCDRCGVTFSQTYNFTSVAVERRLRRQEFERILFLVDYDPPAHLTRLPALPAWMSGDLESGWPQ